MVADQDWFTDLRPPETDYADTSRRSCRCGARSTAHRVPGVDPARIAYVGHDFGAMDGALLLAVDERPKFAVLMAPTLSFWEWYLLGAQPADRAAYVARMSAFDLPGWLPKGKQRATLLQFGQQGRVRRPGDRERVRNAVPNVDRTLKRYDADHALVDAHATPTAAPG